MLRVPAELLLRVPRRQFGGDVAEVVILPAFVFINPQAVVVQRGRGGVAQQVMGRVEGEMLVAGAGQAAQRIVVVAMLARVFIHHLQQLAVAPPGVITRDRNLPVAPRALADQPPHLIMDILAAEGALRAANFPVQHVALAFADNPAAEVHLNTVPAAIVEVFQLAAVRQRGDGAIAELIVLMTKLMADAANEVALKRELPGGVPLQLHAPAVVDAGNQPPK